MYIDLKTLVIVLIYVLIIIVAVTDAEVSAPAGIILFGLFTIFVLMLV